MENWPKVNPKAMKDYKMCFGCGLENSIGLKLKFEWDGTTARAKFVPNQSLQGWGGYLHGGITACVLDEAMGQAALFAGFHNVTAKMQVRFRKMACIDEPYIVSCTITRKTSRLLETEASLIAADGTVVADASSTQFIVNTASQNND
jgi:acyl-coenzyme A thioesterase PaaI-like protein